MIPRPRPLTRGQRGAVLLAFGLVVAACSGGVRNLNIPTPPGTQPAAAGGATTTVSTDLTGVNLTPIPSTTPPTVLLTPGKATLSGIVSGPSGVVAGATVLVTRVVGDPAGNDVEGSKTVVTAVDGTWTLSNILGGRYLIRAWMAPTLALTTPMVLLLGATQTQSVPLIMMAYGGQSLSASIAPSPPQVGQVATLFIQATQQTVGADGVVRAAPLAGATIQAYVAGNVVLAGTNPATTGSSGEIELSLGCSSDGPVGLSATIDALTSFQLSVPDCGPFVPVPTVTTPTTVFTPATTTVP